MVRSFIHIRKNSSTMRTNERTEQQCASDKHKAVLQIVRRKGPPLTAKQLDYCNEACIGRLLKLKGGNVKKAAKQLRQTLAWRTSLDIDFLTADEFCGELASGLAFVAGVDDVGRPVVIVRLTAEILTNNDYQAHNQFLRYFAFTMEVAITCMAHGVEQCVLIFDAAGCVKAGSHAGISAVTHLLKLLGEHYPERLAKTFILDAPSLLYYLWKGIGKFLDIKTREKPRFVFTRNYTASAPASGTVSQLMKAARTYSNRILWTPSEDLQSDDEDEGGAMERGEDRFEWDADNTMLKIPRASTTTASASASASASFSSSSVSSTASSSSSSLASCAGNRGAALISDKGHARSFSFASASSILHRKDEEAAGFRSFRADMRSTRKLQEEVGGGMNNSSRRWVDFALGARKQGHCHQHGLHNYQQCNIHTSHRDKTVDLFRPYYTAFLTSPYDETAYRGRMKPPLAGLLSILSQELRFKQHPLQNRAMEAMLYHLHLD